MPVIMSFFDTVLSSLNDPHRETDTGHLESMLAALSGANPASAREAAPLGSDNAQALAGALGGFLKPLLQQTQARQGLGGVEDLLGALGGRMESPQALDAAVGPENAENMVAAASRRTGLDTSVIWKLLPVVLPAVVGMLQSGRRSASAPAAPNFSLPHANPILAHFLDSDGDGDVDLADTVRLASQFLASNRR